MRAVAVGAAAPEVLVHAFPTGQTRVLAFVRRWSAEVEDPATLRTIRAQLRGLGAELIILSDSGVWSFRADDELERSDRAIASAAMLHGLRARGDAIIIVDGGGIVRHAHKAEDSLATSLAGALQAAARQLLTHSATFNRRQWIQTCLASSAALAVAGASRPRRAEARGTQPPIPVPTELELALGINGKVP